MFTLETTNHNRLTRVLDMYRMDIAPPPDTETAGIIPHREKVTFPLYIYIAKLYTNRRCSVGFPYYNARNDKIFKTTFYVSWPMQKYEGTKNVSASKSKFFLIYSLVSE